MKQLPFRLADFSRVIWMSENARAVWQPRLNNINEAWARIERWAVVEGVRESALTFFEPSYLPEASQWAASHGLLLLPMATVGLSDQYSATPKAVEAGRPWQYRAVLTKPERAKDWIEAWKDNGQEGRYKGTNNRRIGELLGYPQCCIDFFERTWVKEASVDTTWDMALATVAKSQKGDVIQLNGPPECNILLRWLGVRLVAHLPCSFHCQSTFAIAQDFAIVGRKRHFGEWVDWIYEMLEWPIEWSALHGIAEIRTPVLTVSSRTNATAGKAVVQRAGSTYPDEGAQGLKFPFKVVTGKVTEKPSYKRSFLPIHELNGFGSETSMVAAHDALLSCLPEALDGTDDGGIGRARRLLDLGCGNGRFLERAKALGWDVHGVEIDSVRSGAATLPIQRCDLFDVGAWDSGRYDVIAFMPGRLIEQKEKAKADALRSALITRADKLLLYAYGDWLTKYGTLGALIAAAGLQDVQTWLHKSATTDGVSAVLVSFKGEAT